MRGTEDKIVEGNTFETGTTLADPHWHAAGCTAHRRIHQLTQVYNHIGDLQFGGGNGHQVHA